MRLTLAVLIVTILLAVNPVRAENPQPDKMKTCNVEASEKKLKGHDRQSFMEKCLGMQPKSTNEQQGKLKTCNAQATARHLMGHERQTFMRDCLSNH